MDTTPEPTDPADGDGVERVLRAGLEDFDLTPEDRALIDGFQESDEEEAVGPLPVVAIIGRPNVGKSTLVNRILRRREAVVEDTPGVTRDRVAYEGEWAGRHFTWLGDRGVRDQPARRRAGRGRHRDGRCRRPRRRRHRRRDR